MAKTKKNVTDYKKVDASTIVSVEVCTVRVPLDRVTSFASRTVQARDLQLNVDDTLNCSFATDKIFFFNTKTGEAIYAWEFI